MSIRDPLRDTVIEEMEWAAGQLAIHLRHLRAKNDPMALAFTNALAEFNDTRKALSASPSPQGLREAFVAGAKWWEFESTGATMWQSDQNKAHAEAARRYPESAPAETPKETRYVCRGCGKRVSESDLSDDKTRHAVWLLSDVDFCGPVEPETPKGGT